MLTFQTVFAALLVAITVIPFLPIAHGFVRVGDFPRQQILVVALGCLVVSLVWADSSPDHYWFEAIYLAVIVTQAAFIAQFTFLWKKQSKAIGPDDRGHRIRLLASNVKMSNRRYDEFTTTLEEADADIVIVMEADAAWGKALEPLFSRATQVVERYQENSYGMALASKFPLEDVTVQDLLTEGVPSIFATVVLPEGQKFRLYSIHPEPPVPHRGSEGRDGETSLVALKVREETLPVIVTGDLNDVAWSKTTRRFRRVSRLLDPRIGRRMINTFDARYWFIRWPLDHLFHSPHFRLGDMKRLAPGGSDHFPVQFDLMLCPDPEAEDMPEQADRADIDRAKDLVDQARRRDEDPIGTDWEK